MCAEHWPYLVQQQPVPASTIRNMTRIWLNHICSSHIPIHSYWGRPSGPTTICFSPAIPFAAVWWHVLKGSPVDLFTRPTLQANLLPTISAPGLMKLERYSVRRLRHPDSRIHTDQLCKAVKPTMYLPLQETKRSQSFVTIWTLLPLIGK